MAIGNSPLISSATIEAVCEHLGAGGGTVVEASAAGVVPQLVHQLRSRA